MQNNNNSNEFEGSLNSSDDSSFHDEPAFVVQNVGGDMNSSFDNEVEGSLNLNENNNPTFVVQSINIPENMKVTFESNSVVTATEVEGLGHVVFEAGSTFNGHIISETVEMLGQDVIPYITSLNPSSEFIE